MSLSVGLSGLGPKDAIVQRALAILRRPGIAANVYGAGVGAINALQAGNYTLSGGSTGLSAVDGSAGLVLDGLGAVGAELVTNGTNPTVITGWNITNGTLAIVGGTLQVTSTAAGLVTLQQTTTGLSTAGLAQFSIQTVTNPSNLAVDMYARATQIGVPTNTLGTRSGFVALNNTLEIVTIFIVASGASQLLCTLNNISVKQVTGIHASQSTAGNRPTLRRGALNLLLNSATLGTQGVTCIAAPYTLAFTGTGTVTLTGASTAGPLIGTGASNRVSLTFTPTAGSVTFTVTGSVTFGQLEIGSTASGYSPTTGAAASNPSAGRYSWAFDGTNDSLALGSVPFQMADDFAIVAAVIKNLATGFGGVFSVDDAGANAALLYIDGITPKMYLRASGTSVIPTAGTVPAGAPFVVSGLKRGVNASVRKNSVAGSVVDATGVGSLTFTASRIGFNTVSTAYMNGNISIVILVKGTLSDADMLVLERFAALTLPNFTATF